MGGYIGARVGTISATVANVQDVTATDTTPEVTIVNSTHEDTDGGREGKVIFKGQQSGGEETTLAQIEASHDGTADDEKGDLIFRTNDGNDGTSPTERLRINSGGDMLFSSEDPSLTLANTTHEDGGGGRESTIAFQGEQSGGEISTLAQIEASHDGTADDQKGDLIFRTNDGSDGVSPTERVRINSLGQIGINTSSPDVNGFGSGSGILTVASDTGSAKTAMLNLVGDGNDTNNTRVASLFYNDASATGAGATIAGIEAYRASGHATDGGANLIFSTNIGSTGGYAERMRIRAAGGLTFNGDTAEANALDDYETGTFQMSLGGVSGGARGTGIYVKIGNLVHFQWYSGAMTVTSAAPVITGLPFTATDPHSSAAYSGFIAYHNTYVSNASTGYINIGSTSLYFTALNSTGGPTIVTGSNIYCMVAGQYHAA
jgi:hypothetical protein